jgi:hypothetical protein
MSINKLNPFYVFIVGSVLLLVGALLKILHLPLFQVFIFWGLALKLYCIIRIAIMLNHTFKNNRNI